MITAREATHKHKEGGKKKLFVAIV